jgi:glycosyltransferase involved in cell wall biosynthesis
VPNRNSNYFYFSIIIPGHNRADTISRAIVSCLDQSFDSFEIVVVDDGSTDETEPKVRSYADPRIVYVYQPRAGAAAARNLGADVARGAYLAFLDSDDEFLPGKLAAFSEAIEATARDDAERTVWYSPLIFMRRKGNALRKPARAIEEGEPVGDYLFAYDGLLQTSTLVMSKVLFDKVRFNTRLKSLLDLDLSLRLEAVGARFRMLPEPYVIWYDDTGHGRLSYSTTETEVMAWAESVRGMISEKAYHGLLARQLTTKIVRRQPFWGLRLLLTATRSGSISLNRATTLLLRGVVPRTYAAFRDWLVSRSFQVGRSNVKSRRSAGG